VITNISSDSSTMTFDVGAEVLTNTPIVVLSRSTMVSFCNLGATAASQTFSICNGQGGTLNYTVSTNQSWLSCTPASGSATTESDTITVNFATGALSAGTYSATITVSDPAAFPSNQTLSVSLTVYAQPLMTLSTNSISKNGVGGINGPLTSFTLRNTGGGVMTYSLTNTQSWLTLSPTSGIAMAETDTIYVNLDARALTGGTYNDTITVTSLEASNSPQTIPVTFTVIDGPEGAVSPTNLWLYSRTGTVVTASVVITNSGGSDLTFSITDNLAPTPNYSVLNSDQGGGPTYNWIDISTNGTLMTLGGEEESAMLDIGFNFPYYDSIYTQFMIAANGVVSFTTNNVHVTHDGLPTTRLPSQALAVYWDDLNPQVAGQIRYHRTPERLVVSWLGVHCYGVYYTTHYVTFQVVIYPDGRIVYQYQEAGDPLACTVGIQDSRTAGPSIQLANTSAYLHNNMAVRFTPPPTRKWLSYVPSSGSVPPNCSTSVWFTASPWKQADGVYTAQVTVAMNDIDNPQVVIPVVYTVDSTPLPEVILSKISLAVAEGGTNDTYTLVLARAPTNDVVVTVMPNAEVAVDQTQVIFTTNTWSQPQTITVTAVDDAKHDSPLSGLITHSVASSDTNYNGLAVRSLPVLITDNDGNSVPVVDAGPDQVVLLEGGSATANLNGSATDEDGDPLTNTWTAVSGPGPVVFDYLNALDTTVNFNVPGVYTLRLTASDGPATTNDDVVITVTTNVLDLALLGPSNLSATGVATNQIDLSWTDNSTNETGFAIERSLTSGSGFVQIGSVAANVTAYSDVGVPPYAGSYYYRVVATNDTDRSAPSGVAFATTLKLTATVSLGNLSQVYDGTGRAVTATTDPAGLPVTLTYNGSATAPINVGTYAVTGTISHATYIGQTNGTLTVTPKSVSGLTIADVGPFTYDGLAKTPSPSISDGATMLVKETHYTLGYSSNTNVGTATLTLNGIGNYAGSKGSTFEITPATFTVTPTSGQSKPMGSADPLLTYGSSGAVAGQTAAFTGALSRDAGEAMGTYPITQGTLALADNGSFNASNYTLSFTAGVLFTITENSYMVPFQEPFDLRETAPLHGQHGWVAPGTDVQTNVTFGQSAKAAFVSGNEGYLKHTFTDGKTKVWMDMRVKPVRNSTPVPDPTSAGAFYVATNNMVMAFNRTNVVETGLFVAEGQWTRFTVFSDYTAQTYVLYVNDVRAGKYSFYCSTNVPASFEYIKLGGGETYVDDIGVTQNQPAMKYMPSLILLR
jgi:MBG domain/MBG domain (YGX type)/Viral BACON domain